MYTAGKDRYPRLQTSLTIAFVSKVKFDIFLLGCIVAYDDCDNRFGLAEIASLMGYAWLDKEKIARAGGHRLAQTWAELRFCVAGQDVKPTFTTNMDVWSATAARRQNHQLHRDCSCTGRVSRDSYEIGNVLDSLDRNAAHNLNGAGGNVDVMVRYRDILIVQFDLLFQSYLFWHPQGLMLSQEVPRLFYNGKRRNTGRASA